MAARIEGVPVVVGTGRHRLVGGEEMGGRDSNRFGFGFGFRVRVRFGRREVEWSRVELSGAEWS